MDDPTSTQWWSPPECGRERAILRAIAAGRGELVDGVDLYVDGRHCSDQSAAFRLVRTRCIEPASRDGGRVAAIVTMAGWALLGVGRDSPGRDSQVRDPQGRDPQGRDLHGRPRRGRDDQAA